MEVEQQRIDELRTTAQAQAEAAQKALQRVEAEKQSLAAAKAAHTDNTQRTEQRLQDEEKRLADGKAKMQADIEQEVSRSVNATAAAGGHPPSASSC